MCVRLPGGGITRRMAALERFYEREYRQFGIDALVVQGILEAASQLAESFKIVVIPSGAGAFLLSDLARRLDLSAADVAEVSMTAIRAQVAVVHRWLDKRLTNGCRVVAAPEEILEGIVKADACVMLPSSSFSSTDALWAASAYRSSAVAAFNFKRLTPSAHIVQDALVAATNLDLQWLTRNAAMWGSASASPMLDLQALSYLAETQCEAWILQPECPDDMRRVLADKHPTGTCRRISLGHRQ